MRKNIFTVLAMVITTIALITACSAPGTTTPGGPTPTPTPASVWAENGGIKIAYVTTAATATDAVSNALVADTAFDVVVRGIGDADMITVCGQADMVLCSEAPATTVDWVPLRGLNKPMLLQKTWVYRSDRPTCWGWAGGGYGNDGNAVTTLTVTDTAHPIFTGITLDGSNAFSMLSSAVGITNLAYMTPASFTGTPTVNSLANVTGYSSEVSILEIPVGTTMASGTAYQTLTTQRFLQIGIHSAAYGNISTDGMHVIKNACYYLTGNAVPGALASGTITFNLTGAGAQNGRTVYALTASPVAGGSAAIAGGTASFEFTNGVTSQVYPGGNYNVAVLIDVDDSGSTATTGGDYTYAGTVQVNGNATLAVDLSQFTQVPLVSSEKAITAFSFPGLPAGTITEGTHTIDVTVPFGTDVSALIATFTASNLATVGVFNGSTWDQQTSGSTANNFTSPVTYRVTAEDLTTQDYVVTVTVTPASSAKAITAFAIVSPAATGTIAGNAIAVTVPNGTDVTALVATFTASAYATVGIWDGMTLTPQTSGVTANNFTSPVTYRVTAQDLTTQDFTVTVTIAAGAPWVGEVCDLFGTAGSAPSGSISVNTQTAVTMTAAGGNLSTTGHRFYYVNTGTPVTGDFVFTARVVSITGTKTINANAYRYGLYFCENKTAAGAYIDLGRFVGLELYGTTTGFIGSRSYKADVGTGSTRSRSDVAAVNNVGFYLRLQRVGNTFQSLYSTDGVTFTQVNSSSFANVNGNAISSSMYIGFYAAPGADTLTFAFDNISITQ